MNTPTRRPAARQDWEALAQRAMQSGDLIGARAAYMEALRHDRRNSQLHFEHAAVLAALGEVEDSAVALTKTLRLKPQHDEAARRLSRLLGRFVIAAPGQLDPLGLKAALGHHTANSQPIAETALKHLAATQPDLEKAVAGVTDGAAALETARKLVVNRTGDFLKSDLLLTALQKGVVMDADLERLFTAIRCALLLDVAPARFEDRALTAFALALVVQCRNNDHAWAETEAEGEALDRIELDKLALFGGDLETGRQLILLLLYRPLEKILDPDDIDRCHGIKPKPLREVVVAELERRAEERSAVAGLPRLTPITDAMSRRVAGQYEASPYPRWQTLHAPRTDTMKAALSRFFEPSRLAFMDDPFDVLIAGAGTGKQALQAAFAYGPQAKLLAVDLSAASLGYAASAAKRFGVSNVDFLVADILDLDRLDRTFDVIECVGVLHHMADPWAGWRKLLSRLKPDGLMYVGLYSSVSRSNIRALRAAEDHPGAACDDSTARAYRADLLNRPDGAPGSELKISRDFYTLNEFRDLLLHENEQHVSLSDISSFLNDNGLAFRGFALDPSVLNAFSAQYPDSPWPGSLEAWAEFERAHPTTFDGMYLLWCERLPAGDRPAA